MKMHARLSLKTENDGVIDGLEWFLCLQDTGRWRFKPRGLNITWSSTEGYWTMPEKGY
jgi:hypothetical protein